MASAGLHVLAVAVLTASSVVRLAGPDEVPPIEVVMLERPADVRGAQATAAQPPSAPSPPAPTQTGPQPTAPAAPAPPQPPSPPEMNLGGLEDESPLTVSSDTMKPPEPDSRFRNLPPDYPAEAARMHAEGTVQMLVHVTSRGYPSQVVIARSSGNEALDQAALRAVQLWRFKPARANGLPVPFDYPVNIRFTMGHS